MTKQIAILGSTGSIGTSTLDVVRRNPESYRVVGLAANRNAALLLQQAREFAPETVALSAGTPNPEIGSSAPLTG